MVSPEFRRMTLENGATLVAERHPNVHSVCIGIWVKVGASLEKPAQGGISHFVEHMVFKGTEKRSAIEIVTALEGVGGDLNGFTDKEFTCYHAIVLSEHLEIALDVLGDLVFHPTFPKEEFDRERKILLQELRMVEESPDDWITDIFLKEVWKGEPLGQPIVGDRRSIARISRSHIVRFYDEHYRPDNLIISVAGNFDFEFLKDRCEYFFGSAARERRSVTSRRPSQYHRRRKHVVANTEHLHLLLGFEGLGVCDPQRFELLAIVFLLGGGMSSRLFQEIREKAALAYLVDCDYLPFSETGVFSIYVATTSNWLGRCLRILGRELHRLKAGPLPEQELEFVRGQLRGAVLLSADEMSTRQESLARNESIFGRYVPVEETIERIDNLTAERIQETAARLFVPEKESVFTLGTSKPRIKGLSIF